MNVPILKKTNLLEPLEYHNSLIVVN
jgi:hypothetical protein